MPQNSNVLQAIYVEGETKTGKGAASQAIALGLIDQGLQVYYDVAGDFFRRYVAIIRRQLGLGEADDVPPAAELTTIATELYASGQAFDRDPSLGDLQRPAISRSVSLLGELPIAQEAAAEWYKMSVQAAISEGATVMVLDGRNPRRHVEKLQMDVRTILDVYMTCDPAVAAARMTSDDAKLQAETNNIADRRARDRQRPEWPFWMPPVTIAYAPSQQSANQVVKLSWRGQQAAELPLPITLDNTEISKTDMLAAVAELAAESVRIPLAL